MSTQDHAEQPVYHVGQVMWRGKAAPHRTTDQALLDPSPDTSWLHDDTWRVLRIQGEFVAGFDALAQVGPAISVFGSARTPVDSPYYAMAREIGAGLARAGYAVITGGGPGSMEAVNRGAAEAGGTSIGLGIELPHEQSMNSWVTLGVNFRYFFARKVMFVKYARGFIVTPGGFGTFDELFEALTLVQTHKVAEFPVVLVGREYWGGLLDWVRAQVLGHGMVASSEIDLLHVVDSAEEAVTLVTRPPSTN